MAKQTYEERAELPSSVKAEVLVRSILLKGPKGEDSEVIPKNVSVKVEGNELVMFSKNSTRREKRLIGTLAAHVKSIIHGLTEGCVYKMKVCSGHFPMNVSISGNKLIVKNFFGEKAPRTLEFPSTVKIKVNGDEVVIESYSRKIAGQIAANIEKLTSRTKYDRRVFQDGIYIVSKDGKLIE